jgi:hypothetical protein
VPDPAAPVRVRVAPEPPPDPVAPERVCPVPARVPDPVAPGPAPVACASEPVADSRRQSLAV